MITAGQLDEAERTLEQKRGAEPDSRWHFLKGLLCEKRGDAEAAILAYQEAIDKDAANVEASFRLAFNLDLRGLDDEAREQYERCTHLPETRVNALINLAVLYEDVGEFEAAARCLRRVLGAFPNHPRARLFLKDVESSMNMYYDEDQERNREKHSAVLDTPVTDFELSVRSRNCLKKMNINTLGDLLRTTEAELLSYKNFGETSLNEIKAMLSQKGLRLGQAIDDGNTIPKKPATPKRPLPANVPPDVLNKPVAELELSVRARKCLQRLNIVTLGELAMHTESELLATKNFGQTSLGEIKQRLTEHGLTLRPVGA